MRNQNWKDSEDGMVFRDGSLAVAPIAAAEVHGYVYDAKLRFAELEREVWGDPAAADRLELEASELRRRFRRRVLASRRLLRTGSRP
jgi:glycogen debranching enzyme